jgi:hypothetical protein
LVNMSRTTPSMSSTATRISTRKRRMVSGSFQSKGGLHRAPPVEGGTGNLAAGAASWKSCM